MPIEICRTLEQPAPTPPVDEGGAGGRSVERPAPTRLVKISGRDLADEALIDKVVEVCVEETARGLSKARVVLLNDRLAFTDHELLQGKQIEVECFTGYTTTRFQTRGRFRAAVPKYAFRNAAMPTITLDCYGEEWPLAVNEERQVYENLRDSEIATRIARRYGLKTDIAITEPIHEHVGQFNMTDMEFLENRALLHGYDVYVQDKVLHFHPPRFVHSGLTLLYGRGERGVLTSFHVTVDPWIHGSSWTRSGIDRLTGAEWEFKSQDTSDPLARELRRRGGAGFQTAAELAEIDGKRPRRFIVGDGHEQTQGEARAQVQGFAQASEWVVLGSADVQGIEVLRARQVVTILGLHHLSGDYYVTAVTHSVSPRGYRMQFTCTRPGVGKLQDRFLAPDSPSRQRRDATSESVQAGTVEVG